MKLRSSSSGTDTDEDYDTRHIPSLPKKKCPSAYIYDPVERWCVQRRSPRGQLIAGTDKQTGGHPISNKKIKLEEEEDQESLDEDKSSPPTFTEETQEQKIEESSEDKEEKHTSSKETQEKDVEEEGLTFMDHESQPIPILDSLQRLEYKKDVHEDVWTLVDQLSSANLGTAAANKLDKLKEESISIESTRDRVRLLRTSNALAMALEADGDTESASLTDELVGKLNALNAMQSSEKNTSFAKQSHKIHSMIDEYEKSLVVFKQAFSESIKWSEPPKVVASLDYQTKTDEAMELDEFVKVVELEVQDIIKESVGS